MDVNPIKRTMKKLIEKIVNFVINFFKTKKSIPEETKNVIPEIKRLTYTKRTD